LSKSVIVYQDLEWTSPVLDCVFGVAALMYASL
jgi:hypothetical protein